jgi:valyl-tRNA synthetase
MHCTLHSYSRSPCAVPPNILSTCSVIDRNFANKLWNAGKYISNCLASSGAPTHPSTTTSLSDGAESTASTAQELAVTGPMTPQELNALPVPERYIVSRCHEVVQEVTKLLEALSFSDAG